MPFDPIRAAPALRNTIRRSRAVGAWLVTLCVMLFVMVVLGGATRLTGSGLSIMEWAPLSGALPPLSAAEWRRLFALYQQIPQYELVNHGLSLEGFRGIFWLEWVHRLWGRLLGVALLGPLAWFTWRRQIGRRLAVRLGALFVLGGLQGAVGWFMVASGFAADSTAVSAYRLVAHLALALTLYAALLWTALSIWRAGAPAAGLPRRLQTALGACCLAVGCTIVAGGFVAGLHAGLCYNTFPLMDGQLVPADWAALHPLLRNLTENVAAVQFDHRLLATGTLALVSLTVVAAWRARPDGRLRPALLALAAAVLTQYCLGVLTLVWAVPIALAVMHQAVAVLVLTAALASWHAAAPMRRDLY